MTKNNTSMQNQPHHYVRTLFAGLFGMIALVLVLASILVVWTNRTLTDTTTYVETVAPLVDRPAVKDFVASRVAEQLRASAPPQELAGALLPPDQIVGKTPEQLAAASEVAIRASVAQILNSPTFATLWRQTNQANHANLLQQIESNSPDITLDLGVFVSGVVQELKRTRLAPLSEKIALAPEKMKVNLKGSQVERVHTYYQLLQTATPVVVLITLVAFGLCVLISVHHMKTLRRMLAGTASIALSVAGAIYLPSVVSISGDNAEVRGLATSLVTTLLHPLQVVCLIIAGICLTVVVASKLYEWQHARRV